jgi:hypothetical protein
MTRTLSFAKYCLIAAAAGACAVAIALRPRSASGRRASLPIPASRRPSSGRPTSWAASTRASARPRRVFSPLSAASWRSASQVGAVTQHTVSRPGWPDDLVSRRHRRAGPARHQRGGCHAAAVGRDPQDPRHAGAWHPPGCDAHGARGDEVQVAVALVPRDERLACIEVAPRALPADHVQAFDGQALEQVDAAQRQAGRLQG